MKIFFAALALLVFPPLAAEADDNGDRLVEDVFSVEFSQTLFEALADSDEELERLEQATHMREIEWALGRADKIAMTGVRLMDLSFLREFENLRELRLGSSDVRSLNGIEHLAASLTALDLTGVTLENLTFLQEFENLQELRVGGAGIQSLYGIEEIAGLRILDASRNPLGNLRELDHLGNLEWLDISDTGGAESFPRELELPGNPLLETLLARGNGFESADLSANELLREADLRENDGLAENLILPPALRGEENVAEPLHFRIGAAAEKEESEPESGPGPLIIELPPELAGPDSLDVEALVTKLLEELDLGELLGEGGRDRHRAYIGIQFDRAGGEWTAEIHTAGPPATADGEGADDGERERPSALRALFSWALVISGLLAFVLSIAMFFANR